MLLREDTGLPACRLSELELASHGDGGPNVFVVV